MIIVKRKKEIEMKQITQSYLLGIKEGRSHLKKYPELLQDIQTMKTIARSSYQLAKHHSGEMKEMFKGEYDFWKNQIKKARGENA